ncbi:thiamine biosynthesis protein ThiC [Paraburkholderia phenoliruptrix]|nr:thiamine biosynthesis protein ThiC [Paraburkholderia phenoliruptrix]
MQRLLDRGSRRTQLCPAWNAYKARVAQAQSDYEAFWVSLAREELSWNKPFTKVLDESKASFYTW